AEKQARLEYYTTDTRRIKYTVDNAAAVWWRGSPKIDRINFGQYSIASVPDPFGFLATEESGAAAGVSRTAALDVSGVAPAFCVK
ncbi:MAG: hypothetical protein LBR16_05345, partial [Treponema sp.]|nr:hypothetical protein [Treponema sp.]